MSPAQDTILGGSLLLAVPVALLAGFMSFFTPCSLPLVPGYLSYVAGVHGQPRSEVVSDLRHGVQSTRRRTLAGAVLFVLGFAAVFTAYGALFGALGSTLVRHQELMIRIAGVITIVLGLLFAGAAERIPLLGRTAQLRWRPRVGLAGAPLLGAVFGIGWTPCVGPALAAVLTLATTSATAGRGAVLSLVYALGLGIPFIAAALSITRAMHTFARVRRHSRRIGVLGGGVLVLIGVLQVSGVWTQMIAALQVVIVAWGAPL